LKLSAQDFSCSLSLSLSHTHSRVCSSTVRFVNIHSLHISLFILLMAHACTHVPTHIYIRARYEYILPTLITDVKRAADLFPYKHLSKRKWRLCVSSSRVGWYVWLPLCF